MLRFTVKGYGKMDFAPTGSLKKLIMPQLGVFGTAGVAREGGLQGST